MSILDTMRSAEISTGVFVQTNEHGTNRVLAFRRGADGALTEAGDWPTGGAGLGAAHLGSQGSVILTADGRFLLVTNAGSDDISVFAIGGRFVYNTNFADGAVSAYEVGPDGSLTLANATAGTAVEAHPGLRDEDLSGDGRYLRNRRRRPPHLRMARRPQWSADLGRLPQRAAGLGRGPRGELTCAGQRTRLRSRCALPQKLSPNSKVVRIPAAAGRRDVIDAR